MNPGQPGNTTVRRQIAEHTRHIHEVLHNHPWISALATPELTQSHYAMVLGAYHAFFRAVEARRTKLNTYAHLSLRSSIGAMATDVLAMGGSIAHPLHPDELTLETHSNMLGALYVLHGAGFGAAIMKKNVLQTLPGQPISYLSAPANSTLWRQLIQDLDDCGDDAGKLEDLRRGAQHTFECFGTFVSAYCNTLGTAPD